MFRMKRTWGAQVHSRYEKGDESGAWLPVSTSSEPSLRGAGPSQSDTLCCMHCLNTDPKPLEPHENKFAILILTFRVLSRH